MHNTEKGVILQIENVCKEFPGVKALDRVSISVARGSVHGIVGENGAGKSTLMKILSGVYTKDEGTIIFDDEIITETTPMESMKRGLSIIYQELNLVNTLSVGENIFLGRLGELGGVRNVQREARKVLQRIGCNIDTRRLVEDLSVSEKQMIEISKALSFDSKLIIMDEPSSSLTADEMKELALIIQQLRESGISIIYISHKLDEIFEFCNTVTIMRDGHVIDTKPVTELTRSEMIAKMVGRTIENEYPPRPNCVGDTLLEIEGINTNKLKDISFTLNRGEILGFVGLVGAGRTEIVRAIFGADKVSGHRIKIDGKFVNIRSPKDAKRAGIALVPEDRKLQGLVLSFSVEENISMAVLDRLCRYGILSTSSESTVARRHVKSLAIKTPSERSRVESLSGGNQQKCIVGRWLELKPRVLILDEPTRGIDVGAKYEIYMLMKKIVEDGGSVILISSELPEVLNMSNRILTVCDGRITGEFDPLQYTADQIMEKALDFSGKEEDGESGI